MEVESFKLFANDPGGYAGTVFFDVAPSFREDLRCLDSDQRTVDGCGVYVMIPERSGWAVANTDIRVPPRGIGEEFPVFFVSLGLDVTGTVSYIYRIVPREESDRTRHHDLDEIVVADETADANEDATTTTTDTDSDGDELRDDTDPLDPDSRRSPRVDQDLGPAADPCADVGPGAWIVIGSRSGPPGRPARIPINVCGADGLGDLNLTVDYDTALLRATGFLPGAFASNPSSTSTSSRRAPSVSAWPTAGA